MPPAAAGGSCLDDAQALSVSEELVDVYFRGISRGVDAVAGEIMELAAEDVEVVPDHLVVREPIKVGWGRGRPGGEGLRCCVAEVACKWEVAGPLT